MVILLEDKRNEVHSMNYSFIPPTGEQPISPWIMITIIVSALALVAAILAPKLPHFLEYLKNKLKK